MEQRIKIVWIFSIASILLITCGQVYWLRNQYQYMNDEQINGIYDCILQTAQQYDSIRTPQPKRCLAIPICSSISLANPLIWKSGPLSTN